MDVPDHVATVEIGVTQVVAVGRKLELQFRELANLQHGLKFLAQRRRRRRIRQQDIDRLAPGQNLVLPVNRLPIIANALAAAEEEREPTGGQADQSQPELRL